MSFLRSHSRSVWSWFLVPGIFLLGWGCWLATPSLAASPAEAAGQWPEFRGPTGDGLATSAKLPTTWSEQEHVRWKTPLPGKAWSSPVAWGDLVWVTTAPEDGKQLFALGLDWESGKILHEVLVFENPFPQYCIDRNSYASSTPVIEAGRLYAHYGAHGTACLDTATGKILWSRRDLPCFHHRGPASSPILFGDLLILTFDGFDLQYVTALDKHTGKTVWKTDRVIDYGTENGDVKKGYGTPSVFSIGGQSLLVSPSAGAAVAYDALTGKERWRVRAGGMNVAARPLMHQGLLILSSGDGGFTQYAVRPDGQGDITATHVAWKNPKGSTKYASSVLVGGLLFTGNEQGIVSCLDPQTGEAIWQKRVGGSFTASPLCSGEKIYFFNEDGQTHVIAAAREFQSLAVNRLDGAIMASPAARGDSLIVRTTTHLYRID